MAQLVVDIPDPQVQRALEAFAWKFGWVDQATSGTKASFAKKRVASYIRQITLDYEQHKAEAEALAAVVPPTPIDAT